MKKQSKYRIRKMKLQALYKEYVKGFTLTKTERHLLKEWVRAGNSPYDGDYGLFEYMDFISSLRAQNELDTLLQGLTESEKNYVESYCINFDPFSRTPYFDFDKLEELDLHNLPVEPVESEKNEADFDFPF